jgi:hypothetical protein
LGIRGRITVSFKISLGYTVRPVQKKNKLWPVILATQGETRKIEV